MAPTTGAMDIVADHSVVAPAQPLSPDFATFPFEQFHKPVAKMCAPSNIPYMQQQPDHFLNDFSDSMVQNRHFMEPVMNANSTAAIVVPLSDTATTNKLSRSQSYHKPTMQYQRYQHRRAYSATTDPTSLFEASSLRRATAAQNLPARGLSAQQQQPETGAVGGGSNHHRYRCATCNKTFSRPSSLRVHMYSHTGEKPHVCPHPGCGRRFSVQSNMRRHLRVHYCSSFSDQSTSQAEEDGTEDDNPAVHSPTTTIAPILPIDKDYDQLIAFQDRYKGRKKDHA